MLRIVELDGLGAGQIIEAEMAAALNVEVRELDLRQELSENAVAACYISADEGFCQMLEMEHRLKVAGFTTV